ncbi:MAG TPA: hypothetical protein VGC07_10180 [Granulicella sp.]
MLSSYGPLCEMFFYSTLEGTTERNWDRTSRQAAIRNLIEGQSLYMQPEPDGTILMVNASGRGVGRLEPRIAPEILKSLDEGRQWHAHVRSALLAPDSSDRDLVVMLLRMVTTEEYDEIRAEAGLPTSSGVVRKPARDFSIEWTLVAMVLIAVAMTML